MESGEQPSRFDDAVQQVIDYARHCRNGGAEDPEETQG